MEELGFKLEKETDTKIIYIWKDRQDRKKD